MFSQKNRKKFLRRSAPFSQGLSHICARLLDLQLVCNDFCDIPKKILGDHAPLNCLEIVVAYPTIKKPGCATDLWPGYFRNPKKIDSKMLLSNN